MPPFQLVIFDCDGVLVDTEPVANAVLRDQLAAIGLAMPLETVMRTFVGRSRADCLEIAARLYGRALPEGFGEEWDRAFDRALERETHAIEGITEVLRSLELPYCVASNGEPARMRLALRAAGLMPLVEGHRHPDGGELALEDRVGDGLGVDQHAIAVEDDEADGGHRTIFS